MSDERPFLAMPSPGIFRITLPLPFPGLNHVHVYAAEGPGGGLVLVDTSLGFEDSFERIEQSVAWLGRRLSDVERIVLTHAHPDHIGLAKSLQDVAGAPVVCHPIAHSVFAQMQTFDKWQELTDHFVEHGRAPEDVRRAFFPLPLPERIEHVEEGDEVWLAGSPWEVQWTPGHEWGHIALFRASDRVVISGDTLLGKITPHVGYTIDPPDPLGMFLDTLDGLARLDPAFVLPGHGRSFDEGAERAAATRRHHEQRLRRCMEILQHRGPTTGLDVAREIFGPRNLMFFHERLALSETLSHLEYLRLRGRVRRERVDGIWRYEAARVVG